MKVKEVLALAASTLGRDDLCAAVSCAREPEGDTAALLRCYNLVENEIALDYFPLKNEESFSSDRGEIAYTQFAYAPVAVCSVKRDGASVPFEQFPAYLKTVQGKVNVTYSYTPAQRGLEDESSFSDKISARLLSLGVATEFCLSRGQYSEAAMWEKKYRDALRAANIVRRKLAVRSRRWV